MSRTGILAPPLRAQTIGAVALISLSAFEALAVATAMPVVARSLDGLRLYPLAFAATLAAAVVGMVAAGTLADRSGPAVPLRWGVGIFVVGLCTAGLAPSMEVLVVGRLLQGLGAGLFDVALYVVVGRYYPAELRPRIFAAFSAAWVIPSLVGPLVAGAIVDLAGWRWVFLSIAVGAVGFAGLVVGAVERDDSRGQPPGADRWPRLGWAIAAATCALMLNLAGRASGPAAIAVLAAAGAGVWLCASRLLPAGTLRGRAGLPGTVALRGLASAAFFGTEVYLPLLLVHERGLSPTLAGLALMGGALAWSVGSWAVGRIPPDARRTARMQGGMTLIVAGIASAAALLADAVPVGVGMAGWALAGLGMGLVYPTLSVLVLELSPVERHGESSSALQLSDALGAATMLAGAGALFAALLAGGAEVPAFLAAFGLAVCAALAGLVVAGRIGHRPYPPLA